MFELRQKKKQALRGTGNAIFLLSEAGKEIGSKTLST